MLFCKKYVLSSLICFILLVVSCSYNIPDSKVYIIGVGIDYQKQAASYLGTTPTDDVAEFCMYYKYILDSKNIPNETFLMFDWGKPSTSSESVLTATIDISKLEDQTDWTSPYAPSKNNFKALVSSLANGTNGYNKVRKQDLVVFVYSGHGANTGANKSIPANTSYNGAFCFLAQDGTSNDMLSHNEFKSIMSMFDCPVFAIIDSCFSGHLISAINSGEVGESTSYDVIKDYGGIAEYVASFKTLVSVPNITAITASTASQLSWQVPEQNFHGETHGLFLGNILIDLGWTHSNDIFEYYVPPYYGNLDNKMSIHSSLKSPYTVRGIPKPKSELQDMIITSDDLYNKGRTFFVKTVSSNSQNSNKVEQKSLLSIGPCNVILAW